MKYPKIESILKFEHPKITVKFSNNLVKIIDLSPLFSNSMFEPLMNESFFKQAKVDTGGFGIVWNEDIDISEAYLWDNGHLTDQIVA